MKTYAAIYKNNEIRENSSSGGIFSALADNMTKGKMNRVLVKLGMN